MRQRSDGDIGHHHRRVLIDVPERPNAISSTDHEHAVAITLLSEIADELRRRGWPDPLCGDSGDGGALVYSIDLFADDLGLLKRVLEAFASRSRR